MSAQTQPSSAAEKSLWPEALPPRLAAVAVASMLFAGGCNFAPHYSRPALPTPPAYKELQGAGSVWQPARPSAAPLRGGWWRVFHDAELNALEVRAAAANLTIAAAANNFFAARALSRQARSQFYPSLTTAPAVVNTRPSPAQFAGLQRSGTGSGFSVRSFTSYTLPFDASWEPDLWGRVRNEAGANAYNAQSSYADLAAARLSVAAELAVDYLQLRGQDSLQDLLDLTVAANRQVLRLTQNLYHSGMASDEAVAQAQAQLRTTEAQATNVGIQRDQYEHAIAVLVGLAPAAFSLPALPLRAAPPSIPAGVPSQLLERRPDIAAAERSVGMANAQIGVAKSAWFPNLLLNAAGGFGNASFVDWLTWPSRFWSVGPTLAETLFDAGLRRATTEQYRAIYGQTVANYRQTVLTAFQQVEDNLAALRLLAQSTGQQDDAVAAASRGYREAYVRYRSGLDPYLNVLTAQTALLNARQQALSLRVQQMVSSVQLIKALGGGWKVSQMPTPSALRSARVTAYSAHSPR